MVDNRERIRGPSRDGREGLTSPRHVLRRLLLLSEGRQYREAAGVVGRLGPSLLRSVVSELPMDLLIEALPHSAYLLESFYSRLTAVLPSPKPDVSVEPVVWHLVKLFGNPHESGLRQRCSKLIESIGTWSPTIRDILRERRRALDQAIQGLGIHGLTSDQSGSLTALHTALKTELQRHVDTYKAAIHKLDELSPVTIHQDPAQSSHQRLLAINYDDLQQRLIDNKTVLTLLDKPALKQLGQLVDALSQRVQCDKEVLFCIGEIKRSDPLLSCDYRPVAGIMMNFARGCDSVLRLMGPITVPSSPGGYSCCSDGYHSDSADSLPDETNSELIRNFSMLYSKNRVEIMEYLDSIPQLKNAFYLKTKILFSIIVLAFRSCQGLRERKVAEVRRVLGPTGCDGESSGNTKVSVLNLEKAVRQYLQDTADSVPLGDIEKQVSNQILSTLYEYPCLENCSQLQQYTSSCVRLAWKMVNQSNPYYLDNDFTHGLLQPEKQERHSSYSDRNSNIIRAYVWPALIQEYRCILKAVVIT
uniref:Mitochondria-eating protein n=1 Tax=Lutzomyia longipalpis TaxID=7200 RepID=A0A1B0CUS3_LUTLO